MTGRPARTHDLRFGVLLLLGVAATLGVLYAIGAYAAGDVVPRGTSVAGVDVGGLTPRAAAATLRRELVPTLDEPIVMSVGDRRFKVASEDAGLRIDVPATVTAAYGGSRLNPVRMLRLLTGGDPVRPVLEVDHDALQATLRRIASRVETGPTEPSITFAGGVPRVRPPRPGFALDTEAAEAAVAEEYPSSSGPIALPTVPVDPVVAPPAVRAALAAFGEPAMSAPVTLRVAGKDIPVSPRQYGPALSMQVVSGALRPRFDVDRLWSLLGQRIGADLPRPRDASFVIRAQRPRIRGARPGRTVDPRSLAQALLTALPRSGRHRTVTVATVGDPPGFTAADARRLGITRVVSAYALAWPGRTTPETVRATARVDGTVLEPGEVFSFNGVVGERHTDLSALATTIFNAAYVAGLQDTRHRHHPVALPGYPTGRDVVVGWPDLDFTFTDNTPFGVLIQAWLRPAARRQPARVHVRLFSTPYFRTEITSSGIYAVRPYSTRYDTSRGCRPRAGLDGYDVDIARSIFTGRRLVGKDQIHAAYLAREQVICREPPPATPRN